MTDWREWVGGTLAGGAIVMSLALQLAGVMYGWGPVLVLLAFFAGLGLIFSGD